MKNVNVRTFCNESQDVHKLEEIQNVMDLVGKNPDKLIQVLHAAQEIYGCLPLNVQCFIAQGMNVPVSKVSGVVTFYSFFSTKPRGKNIIRVCMGTACYVRGGKKLVEALQNKLGIGLGETTQDKLFSLEIARCIGACGLAPAIMINDTIYKQVNENKLNAILNEYRQEEEK